MSQQRERAHDNNAAKALTPSGVYITRIVPAGMTYRPFKGAKHLPVKYNTRDNVHGNPCANKRWITGKQTDVEKLSNRHIAVAIVHLIGRTIRKTHGR